MKDKKPLMMLGLLVSVLITLAIWLWFMNASLAKKGPRPVITPLKIAGVEYRVPNTYKTQGIVEAWDVNTGELLWREKIYSTVPIPLLEKDTQRNLIKNLVLSVTATNRLLITNERGAQYELEMPTRKVFATNGSRLVGELMRNNNAVIAAVCIGIIFLAIAIAYVVFRNRTSFSP